VGATGTFCRRAAGRGEHNRKVNGARYLIGAMYESMTADPEHLQEIANAAFSVDANYLRGVVYEALARDDVFIRSTLNADDGEPP
jgi:hypothetical protein